MRYETSAPQTVSSKQVLDSALCRAVSPSVLPPCHPRALEDGRRKGNYVPLVQPLKTRIIHSQPRALGAVGDSSPSSCPPHHSPREGKSRGTAEQLQTPWDSDAQRDQRQAGDWPQQKPQFTPTEGLESGQFGETVNIYQCPGNSSLQPHKRICLLYAFIRKRKLIRESLENSQKGKRSELQPANTSCLKQPALQEPRD